MLVERIMTAIGTIIKPDPIRKRFGDVNDILGDLAILGRIALTISPPTIRVTGIVSRGERSYGKKVRRDMMSTRSTRQLSKPNLTEISAEGPLDLNVGGQRLNIRKRLGIQISSDLVTGDQLRRFPNRGELGFVIQDGRVRVTRTLYRGIHLIRVVPRGR